MKAGALIPHSSEYITVAWSCQTDFLFRLSAPEKAGIGSGWIKFYHSGYASAFCGLLGRYRIVSGGVCPSVTAKSPRLVSFALHPLSVCVARAVHLLCIRSSSMTVICPTFDRRSPRCFPVGHRGSPWVTVGIRGVKQKSKNYHKNKPKLGVKPGAIGGEGGSTLEGDKVCRVVTPTAFSGQTNSRRSRRPESL